jgi:hypothetical protein
LGELVEADPDLDRDLDLEPEESEFELEKSTSLEDISAENLDNLGVVGSLIFESRFVAIVISIASYSHATKQGIL